MRKEGKKDRMKPDWFTLLAIILIVCITAWSYLTVDTRINDAINECNSHWHKEIETACPALYKNTNNQNLIYGNFSFSLNSS